MNNYSTQKLLVSEAMNTETKQDKLVPQNKTICFIKQFARVYHVEPLLSAELNGFIIN
ncbi:MAG: hypothetical protein M0P33_11000 [Massilibacteroides sp.]|nr:hypothetical protein [Massilibacteroides sp.]